MLPNLLQRHVSYVEERKAVIMNAQSQSESPAGTLTPDYWDVPIRVRLVPYVEFSQWLDEELSKLIVRWQGKAAPCALLKRR